MNLFSKKIATISLLISILAMTGCASIGNSGGDSAMMSDLLSERAVIRALYDEPDLTGDPILVGCVDGIITLTGTVDTDIERQLAERVASSVAGVTRVNNNLVTSS